LDLTLVQMPAMIRRTPLILAALLLFACSDPDAPPSADVPVADEAAPTKPAEAAPERPTPSIVRNLAPPKKEPAVKTLPAPADVAAAPADATTTSSGLAYRVLQAGNGDDRPGPTARVEVHYTGWTAADGRMFDSSVVRNETITFGLNQVIKGWTEGVQLMSVGEKTRFWIPGNLAYGDNPRPGAPSGMLVFDIELFSIQ
jgi:peptidylprolyl isomerase